MVALKKNGGFFKVVVWIGGVYVGMMGMRCICISISDWDAYGSVVAELL